MGRRLLRKCEQPNERIYGFGQIVGRAVNQRGIFCGDPVDTKDSGNA